MLKKKSSLSQCFPILVVAISILSGYCGVHAEGVRALGPGHPVVKKAERWPVFASENGEISAVRITDGIGGFYLLHFFRLEPNSLFVPVVLNADMVFYVHSGIGRLSWAEEDELKHTSIRPGDVYRLPQGTLFFIHCYTEAIYEQQRLHIHAIFAANSLNSDDALHEPAVVPYSSIQEMILGFDKKVLQATFKVSYQVIDELVDGAEPCSIVHVDPWQMEATCTRGLNKLINGPSSIFELNNKIKKKKKKDHGKLFNLFAEDKDFESIDGWIMTVTRKKLSAFKGSEIGLFMVNLTAGSMMGPHLNSMGSEIAVVLEGRGMVRAVGYTPSEEGFTRNMRFAVEEGDVFVVPRFHMMTQMAFNSETFVFLGFSSIIEQVKPRVLGGKASILRSLDKDILAVSFNVTSTIIDELLLAKGDDSVISPCTSCAEKELQTMQEESSESGEGESGEGESGRGESGEGESGRGESGEGGEGESGEGKYGVRLRMRA